MDARWSSQRRAYQLAISAFGLQPQDNRFIGDIYPWIGFHIRFFGGPNSEMTAMRGVSTTVCKLKGQTDG